MAHADHSHPRLDSGHARVIAMLKQKGAEKNNAMVKKREGVSVLNMLV